MKQVAQHLQAYAIANYKDENADLFIRSACNRYYYHVFLIVREDLRVLLRAQEDLGHGPKGAGQISKHYKNVVKKLKDDGREIEAVVLQNLISSLRKNFSLLYDVRQEADYENLRVVISSNNAEVCLPARKKHLILRADEIEKKVDEVVSIVQQLSSYRKMVGF